MTEYKKIVRWKKKPNYSGRITYFYCLISLIYIFIAVPAVNTFFSLISNFGLVSSIFVMIYLFYKTFGEGKKVTYRRIK